MLIPTNDAFVALNNARPIIGSVHYTAVAYDAGSEPNDELCAYVPGPVCGTDRSSASTPTIIIPYHSRTVLA